MKTMSVGQVKAEFSEVLAGVQRGETVAVEYGRKKKKVAMIVPYREDKPRRQLGLLRETASYSWVGDGKITEEDMLNA